MNGKYLNKLIFLFLCALLMCNCVICEAEQVDGTGIIPEDYEALKAKTMEYLANPKAPDCEFKETFTAFDIKQYKDVIFSDQCHSSSEAKHTTWNVQEATFVMKCEKEHQIPVYNLGPYNFDYEEYNQYWRFYPSKNIVHILMNAGLEIENAPISMQNADIVQTACVDLQDGYSYHDFYANVIRNDTLVEERLKLLERNMAENNMEKPPVDIRVIVLDSTGRHFFYRHYPNTHEYLISLIENQEKNKGFKVHEMTNYHVVGYNSNPNMYSFITGEQYNEYADFQLLQSHVENGTLTQFKKLIWDYMKEYGYMTTIGEDVPDTDVGTIYGFKGRAHSFDTYPSYNKLSEIVQLHQGHGFSYNSYACPCIGNQFMGEIMLNWAENYFEKHPETPNFVVTVHDESHDGVGMQCMAIDFYLMKHLQWFVETGRTENTAILLFADHGLHYGGGYTVDEEAALLEHENPAMFWFLPDRLSTAEFESSVNRLITMKDVHMTLRDIASYPNRSTQDATREDALSLIYDSVPDTRTCKMVKVPWPFINSCVDYAEYFF